MRTTSPMVFGLLLALLSTAACGGGDGGADTTTGGGGGSGGGGACQAQTMSSLPGVSIEFTTADCNYTLAEAAAGIAIDYEVIVEAEIANVYPRPQDGGECGQPGPSGLILFEDLSGGGERYCLCDQGNCAGPSGDPVTVVQGAHPETFTWDGRNWGGPSDFDAPKGDPFPPGDYTLTVSAVGTFDDASPQTPFQVSGTFLIHLLP